MKKLSLLLFIIAIGLSLDNKIGAMEKPPQPLAPVWYSPQPIPIIPMWQQRGQQQQAESRKFEFSNQSDQYVTVWIPTSHGCWHPTLIYPYRDSGTLTPIERGTIYIFTKATGHFIMQMGLHDSYRLIKEIPSEVPGHSDVTVISHMPYAEVKDVIVIVNQDGSVNFVKRNP